MKLIRISSIRNNKKYPTIKKIFEAGDFYAILSDIVEKINKYSSLYQLPKYWIMNHKYVKNMYQVETLKEKAISGYCFTQK